MGSMACACMNQEGVCVRAQTHVTGHVNQKACMQMDQRCTCACESTPAHAHTLRTHIHASFACSMQKGRERERQRPCTRWLPPAPSFPPPRPLLLTHEHATNRYAADQRWLNKKHIIGRAVGYLPYVGMVTIIMNDYPYLKYALIGLLGIFVLTSRE